MFEPERFTADELRRIQRTLRRRFQLHRRRDLLDVGFGPGLRAARLDPQRPWCVCFYVHRKRQPRRYAERIPRQVQFRLRRGRRFIRFTAATDVIELTKPALSGCVLSYGAGSAVTAGLVVVWQEREAAGLSWAVVTVGHAFPAAVAFPEPLPRVEIRGRGSSRLAGRLLARAPRGRADAAVVQVQHYDLVRCGILDARHGSQALRIRSVDEVKGDEGAPGSSHPRRAARPFYIRAYLPECWLFEDLVGRLRHVIHAHRAQAQTFERGTSGSLWRVFEWPAAMQFGGLQPEFREGFAQILEGVLEWAQEAVGRQVPLQPGTFRAVAAI